MIPQSIIDRAPSAELRPDQRDADSLPPYEVLDPILEGYIEDDLGREALILRGFAEEDVDRVIALVDRAEYKRRQAPPGIKIIDQGVRSRPARADHQPLRRLAALLLRLRPSTGPSPARSGRTATVTRVSAQSLPSSPDISTSHTHVVRPRCERAPAR